jgi:hypothetical protein
MSLKSKKKRGRPALPVGEGKRHPLNMRTTRETRDWLEAAATASGRSLAQEVEFHLEAARSNKQKDELAYRVLMEHIHEQFGGTDIYSLMGLSARAIPLVEYETKKSWLNDTETDDQVQVAWKAILRRCGPEPDQPTKPARGPSQLGEEIAGVLVVGSPEGSRTRALMKKRCDPNAKTLER